MELQRLLTDFVLSGSAEASRNFLLGVRGLGRKEVEEVEAELEELEEDVLLPCSDLASCSFSFKLTR